MAEYKTWLYNGVELPEFYLWSGPDDTNYPVCMLCVMGLEDPNYIWLMLGANTVRYDPANTKLITESAVRFYRCKYDETRSNGFSWTGDGTWEPSGAYTEVTDIVWASCDILTTDGTVYIEGNLPVSTACDLRHYGPAILQKLPVMEGYPYVAIRLRKNVEDDHWVAGPCYDAHYSATGFYIRASDGYLVDKGETKNPRYKVDLPENQAVIGEEWARSDGYPDSYSWALNEDKVFIWANHDILNEDDTLAYKGTHATDPNSTVTGLTLNRTAVSLNRGGTVQFEATVTGTGDFDPAVTYTLSGNSPNGGTTLSETGLLTIGENESSPSVTVTAASVQNGAYKQSAVIQVSDFLSKLSLSVTESAVLVDAEVTTVEYSGFFMGIIEAEGSFQPGDRLSVEFDGKAYTGTVNAMDDLAYFGNLAEDESGPAFTEFPVFLMSMEGYGYYVYTQAPGTYTLKATRNGTVTANTAVVDFHCADLSTEDAVYTVRAWAYKPADGLDTTRPPAYTSPVPFGGPTHTESGTISGLMSGTAYEVYAVIAANGTATEHHGVTAFTTPQADGPTVAVFANNITARSFELFVACDGLEAGREYTAEVIVYNAVTSMVAFEQVLTIVGNGMDGCAVTGLKPETAYTVSVDVYPAPAGEVVVRADHTVVTLVQAGLDCVYAGREGTARAVRAVYVGVNGVARPVKAIWRGAEGKTQPL